MDVNYFFSASVHVLYDIGAVKGGAANRQIDKTKNAEQEVTTK